ncbi:MAG: hypothetical protein IJX06_03100 [Clostridia bacterium]|nr:hypothetical protein [Clostridia bacterium]
MKQCTKCGAQMFDTDTVCSKCHTKFQEEFSSSLPEQSRPIPKLQEDTINSTNPVIQNTTNANTNNRFLATPRNENTYSSGLYAFGIIIGIASIILGIITFFFASPSNKFFQSMVNTGSSIEQYELLCEIFFSAARAVSFGFGSLLIILGTLIIVHFVNKIISKKQ